MPTTSGTALRNWAGNVTFRAPEVARPESVDELRAVVARAGRVRALGTGHSFNDLADSEGTIVAVGGLPDIREVDTAANRVTVNAAATYGELGPWLDRLGYALPNLASLPHISVAGACATGSHGSGVNNAGLASSVAELELVTADGDLLHVRRGDGDHPAAVVALGALGVVVSVTLDLVPSFDVRTTVYEGLDLDVLGDHFDELVEAAYSVCLFTDWKESRLTQVWVMERLSDPPARLAGRPWFTARPAEREMHPVASMSAASVTPQQGVPGPWHERLTHFRYDATPSSGDELQSEYLLRRPDAVAALRDLDRIRDRIHPVLQICEARTIAGDDFWLSPSQGAGDHVSIHFTWDPDDEAVLTALSEVEAALAPYGARPHWGKVFTTPPETVRGLYERLPDFTRTMRRLDPGGKFQNRWTRTYLAHDPDPGGRE